MNDCGLSLCLLITKDFGHTTQTDVLQIGNLNSVYDTDWSIRK